MVETINIQKYKSADGRVYDTLEQAQKADKEWELKQSFDATKEVASFQKMCENNFARIQKRIDAGKSSFPSFWMTEQKYGTDYYVCKSFDDMLQMGWDAFQMWYDYYLCGEDETIDTVKLILATENKKAALGFVLDRTNQGYEYEKMEKIDVKSYS